MAAQVPRRFFVGLITGFCLALALVWFGVRGQLGVPSKSSRWCFEIQQRKQEIANSITRPKLLLAGGSGTLFGINARQIEEVLGLPTVNLGSHAALGADYILRQARNAAKPGDTILLVLEYELYGYGPDNLGDWADEVFLDYVMARDPEYFLGLPFSRRFELSMLAPLDRIKRGWSGRFRALRTADRQPIYDVAMLDERGDQTGATTERKAKDFAQGPMPALPLTNSFVTPPGALPTIRAFCHWARTNGITVIATYPALLRQPVHDNPAGLAEPEAIRRFFSEQEIPVVGDAQEFILPASEFFDTVYHLTEEASHRHTARMIELLRPRLTAKK